MSGSVLGSPFPPEVDSRLATVETQVNTTDTAATTLAARVSSVENGLLLPAAAANTETSSVNASALSVSKLQSLISSTGASSRTLAAPAADGMFKIIRMSADAGDTTLAMTNFNAQANLGTASVITFNDVADSVVLVSVGTKWTLLAFSGVGLT